MQLKHMAKKQDGIVIAPNERNVPRGPNNMQGVERCCSMCLQWKARLEHFRQEIDNAYSMTCKACEGIEGNKETLADGPIIARRRVDTKEGTQ